MRAKIVATIGPASEAHSTLITLIESGLRVARLNFSHGTPADHQRRAQAVRRASKETGIPVALLQDIQGPKVRLGRFENKSATLEAKAIVTLTSREVLGTASVLPTPIQSLSRDLSAGDVVLLDDGKVRLKIQKIVGADLQCVVEVGGTVSDHKGINVPQSALSVPTLTRKDLADLRFGQTLGVDYVALSFVRSAKDLMLARKHVGDTPLIAKIEKPQAIDNLDAIIDASDGIMVARGDLGVEVPLPRLPGLQKAMIKRANERGRITIVATEMLESMIERSRATRAEVSDIANAILDGADALMLSGETAVGKHPIEAVRTMAAVATEAETLDGNHHVDPFLRTEKIGVGVAAAAVSAANRLDAALIVAYTESGATARFLSEMRPLAPILALTPRLDTVRRSALFWGVDSVHTKPVRTLEALATQVLGFAKQEQKVPSGRPIVLVAGVPLNAPGNTNSMLVLRA
jgi:pyruvate kinase